MLFRSVIPQPGHFSPVIVLKKHGIQKDVYRTKHAYARPRIKIKAIIFISLRICKLINLVLDQSQSDNTTKKIEDQIENSTV